MRVLKIDFNRSMKNKLYNWLIINMPPIDFDLERPEECPICMESSREWVQLNHCKHWFCKDCFLKWNSQHVWSSTPLRCATCRAQVSLSQVSFVTVKPPKPPKPAKEPKPAKVKAVKRKKTRSRSPPPREIFEQIDLAQEMQEINFAFRPIFLRHPLQIAREPIGSAQNPIVVE